MNIRQDLEENGYKAYEASISAFGSNYDRAVGTLLLYQRRSCRLWCSTCSKIWT
ncbi:lipase-like domain-containing protein [Staphylococcus aureus]